LAVKSRIDAQQRRNAAHRRCPHGNGLPLLATCMLLAACSTYRPTVPPSETHLSTESVVPAEEKAAILPPVTTTPFVPPPQPKAKATTYSVVVHEVPVKELLLALARDTKENIDIHPGLQGLVSLNAIDETLPSILERISKQVNMRYRMEGRTIVVSPDTPYLRTYKINYVNLSRETTSSISVSGQLSQSTVAGSTESGGKSETSVKSTSKNDFWEVLRSNVESILSSSRNLAQSAEQRQAKAESARAAREERLAQAEAVARAGAGAKDLFDKAFGNADSKGSSDLKQDIIVNQVAGTLTVMGTERQHGLIQQYLDQVNAAASRQVLIECTIAEVELSQAYQAGIDWARLVRGGDGFRVQQQLMGNDVLAAAPRFVIGYGSPGSNVFASLRLLEQFGKTRVLSSPKIMALNNQTALLKVVDNVVYFTVQSQTTQNQTNSLTTVTTTPNTVAVGVVLSLTPQINESGNVTLTVRPTISRVTDRVKDPNPTLTISNFVPQVTVREMESVLQLASSQTAVLGGLIQDTVRRNRDQVPYIGNAPRVGDLFAYRDESATKSELVIFLRPTVVTNPSLDSEELKHLRKLLPEIDRTGYNP
jgi:general secretion pathway protein D